MSGGVRAATHHSEATEDEAQCAFALLERLVEKVEVAQHQHPAVESQQLPLTGLEVIWVTVDLKQSAQGSLVAGEYLRKERRIVGREVR